MKKLLFVLGLSVVGNVLQACMLKVTNDTNQEVLLVSLTPDDPGMKTIKPGAVKLFGTGKARANFQLLEYDGKGNGLKSTLRIKQIACSKSHLIDVNISDASKGTLDKNMFAVHEG